MTASRLRHDILLLHRDRGIYLSNSILAVILRTTQKRNMTHICKITILHFGDRGAVFSYLFEATRCRGRDGIKTDPRASIYIFWELRILGTRTSAAWLKFPIMLSLSHKFFQLGTVVDVWFHDRLFFFQKNYHRGDLQYPTTWKTWHIGKQLILKSAMCMW